MTTSTFGERLRRIREQRGLTQQELAERAGIRYETINRIENGKHAEPRVYVGVALAKALGVTMDYLVGMYDESTASGRGRGL
jgi:transcriptional regulator with XRE-family HTH domain